MRKLPDLDLLKLSDSGDTRDNFCALFRVTDWYAYKKKIQKLSVNQKDSKQKIQACNDIEDQE